MIFPNDHIPEPPPKKSSIYPMLYSFFAILGVIGAGTCGLTISNDLHGDGYAVFGIGAMLVSAAGLVITLAVMAIQGILKATKK
jgi:hypothetical protein